MRVLMVTNTYAPARNGVAAYVRTLRNELLARGHAVEVLTAHLDGRPAEAGVHEVPSMRGFASDFPLPVARELPEGLRGRSFDIVHLHHPVLLGPVGLSLAEATGARTAFTAHSVYTDYLDHYLLGVCRPLKGLAARRIASFVDRVDLALAPSSHVASVLKAWGVDTRVERLDAPADIERVSRDTAREWLAVSPDARIVLAVGRLAPEKRMATVVREFAQVAPLVPEARLIIAGDGPQRARLVLLARLLGLRDRVRVLGGLTRDALAYWYAAADVLVSGSLSETGPMTVIEAMTCGTPCVAYKAPGFEDRIVSGVNGLLVDPAKGELAAGMSAVLMDARVEDALRAGAKAHSAEHTPGRIVDRLLGFYAEMLDAHALAEEL
jgi:glycosyltransferase involved in cell wall biosynthesis